MFVDFPTNCIRIYTYRYDIFVKRCLKNEETNESNILFYSYMYVEDKHNIVTPQWWRLWAPSSTSRTWGHLARPMGSAFSYIFRVVLYWWCVGTPHSFVLNSAPPWWRALPRWWCQIPPQKLLFDGQTHKKLCVKFESFNIFSHVDLEYSSSQPIS